MPCAFVTGASGFIGGHLVKGLLAEGWEVHALTRGPVHQEGVSNGVTFHHHDGSTTGLTRILERVRPEIVFHLASLFLAEHRPEQVEGLVQSNLLLGVQLAEAMAVCGVRNLVNTGTSWQHFGTESYRPVNLYAATKQAFEDLLAYYYDARGLSCITLKLFDTYGPGDRRRKLVNILVEAANSGEPIAMSPGDQTIRLTYTDDVVRAFLVAGKRLMAAGTALLEDWFVDGEALTVQALVERMEKVGGRPILAQWGGRPHRPREVMLPVIPENKCLPGWRPLVSIDAGMMELFREESKDFR